MAIIVVPDCFQESDARRQKDYLYGTLQIEIKCISTIAEIAQKMDECRRIKKKHVPAN